MSSTRILRRDLLRYVSASSAASLLGFRPGLAEEQRERPTIVILFLRGALDGLSALVPYQDRSYYDARPQIAIRFDRKSLRDCRLDDSWALHPELSGLRALYREGGLAAVVAVGMNRPLRSHFDAQDVAETGGENHPLSTGWLARLLDAEAPARGVFDAVCFEPTQARALSGSTEVLTLPNFRQFALPQGNRLQQTVQAGLTRLYPSEATSDRVQRAGAMAMAALERVARIRTNYAGPRGGAVYPRGPLAGHLAAIAEFVRAEPLMRAATVSVTGWDTHRGQGDNQGQLAGLLRHLGDSIASFRRDLGPDFRRVVVVVMTEFGRTNAQNGTGGTDHGHGSVMLLLGGGVRGARVYGDWRGLKRADGSIPRDVLATTDYRYVLEQVARYRLGKPVAGSLFEGAFTPSPRFELFR